MKPDLNDYHVILADGTERNVKADKVSTENDTLTFSRKDDELLVSYAPGTWKMVELERRDDKGYSGSESESAGRPHPEPIKK